LFWVSTAIYLHIVLDEYCHLFTYCFGWVLPFIYILFWVSTAIFLHIVLGEYCHLFTYCFSFRIWYSPVSTVTGL
jgi:hypothetical protein